MKSHILSNGAEVVLHDTAQQSAVICILVRAGSLSEKAGIHGISHFIEHLLFEGTEKRTALQIAASIENLGGEMNAATTEDWTMYYVKVQRKHLHKAIEVLSDILSHPLFDKKAIEKERSIILSEIRMYHDEPRRYQWVQFDKALFKGTKRAIPAYGIIDDVHRITRKDIVDYYNEHYTGRNMVISVVGKDLDDSILKALESHLQVSKGKRIAMRMQTPGNVPYVNSSRKMSQCYVLYGYRAPSRTDETSYAYDVIRAVLGKPLSGIIFKELRLKRSIGYDAGVMYDAGMHYGSIACFASCQKKEIELVETIFDREWHKLKDLSSRALANAKTFLEGEMALAQDNQTELAENLAFYASMGILREFNSYTSRVHDVSLKHVAKIIDMSPKPTFSIIQHP